jgi:hypothetical protein
MLVLDSAGRIRKAAEVVKYFRGPFAQSTTAVNAPPHSIASDREFFTSAARE